MTDLISLIKSAALVLSPIGVDSGKLSLVLAETIKNNYKSYIIAWEPLETKDSNIIILNYRNTKPLDEVKNSLIIFDSLSYLSSLVAIGSNEGISSLSNLLKFNNRIIIIANYGVKESDLKSFSQLDPTACLWKASFADRGQNIQFHTESSSMTSSQDLSYWGEQNLPDCRSSSSGSSYMNCLPVLDNKEKQLKLCNIAYTPELETKIDLLTNPVNMMNDPNTYLSPYRKEILKNGPKIQDLVTNIILNRDKRHIIYTSFDDYYGLMLIQFVLSVSPLTNCLKSVKKGFSNEYGTFGNDYGLRVISIKSSVTIEEQINLIKNFNDIVESPCVLITTTNFLTTHVPMMVDHLHIIDNHQMEGRLVSQLYKYRNYPSGISPPPLHVHHYVTTKSSGDKSVDTEKYLENHEQSEIKLAYWNDLMASASDIILKENKLVLG